jgi:hypothetical protein
MPSEFKGIAEKAAFVSASKPFLSRNARSGERY